MRRRMDIRPRAMNAPMNREARRIEQLPVAWLAAFEHVAVVVDQQQVGRLHLVEGHAVGVHPERVRVECVPYGYVACDALVVAQSGEDAEGAGEPVFEVFALLSATSRGGVKGKGGGARWTGGMGTGAWDTEDRWWAGGRG